MLTAPANWDKLWAQEADMELRAVIAGVTYNRVISCKAYPAAFDALEIGRASCRERV